MRFDAGIARLSAHVTNLYRQANSRDPIPPSELTKALDLMPWTDHEEPIATEDDMKRMFRIDP
jgi:hypothetical protein